ncbi:MAG: hypothetical protein GKR98_02555 [Boseongicola sp.]|nr:MAG: hypothetical protein GKR98_02555 [Boseongicola sp.]
MSSRFGGKYSPNADIGSSEDLPRRRRKGARVNLLFVVPFLLVFTAFQQEPVGLTLDLLAFVTLMLAAWLTREGIEAEDAYDAKKISRRPAIPRKIFGSTLTGLGLALAGLSAETFSLLNPILFAILGSALHFTAFGPDPLKNKGMDDGHVLHTDEVKIPKDVAH